MHYRMTFDQEGYPQMYVFKSCRAFIRTIPELLIFGHRAGGPGYSAGGSRSGREPVFLHVAAHSAGAPG